MFSEEQFEAYRALGYHAAYGLFDRRDDFAKLDEAERPCTPEHLDLLDRLFPRVTVADAPRQHTRFADWLRGGRPRTASRPTESADPAAFSRANSC